MDKICLTCRAFSIDDGEDIGSCQLHPPIAVSDCFMFPGVHPLAWCLDWQAQETPRSRALPPTAGEFDRYWAEVPNKIGKKAAQKAFRNAQDRPPIDDLLEALRKAKRSPQWLKDNGQFIPHPATWLNRGQWADVATERAATVFEDFLARGDEHDGCDRLE